MKQGNPRAEDSFEQARQEFFGAEEKIEVPSAESSKTRNDNAATTPTASYVFSCNDRSSRIANDETIITTVDSSRETLV
jgi:hypothetical protein